MIPLIGLMIGAYVFTRMVETLQNDAKLLTTICAAITLLVVVVCVVGLFGASGTIGRLPR